MLWDERQHACEAQPCQQGDAERAGKDGAVVVNTGTCSYLALIVW